MTPITIISPINKIKVIIGSIDNFNREAIFLITEERYFTEAEAVGIDAKVFNRKAIQWCRTILFKLWDNRIFRISREDFSKNAWIYPIRADKDFKAPPGEFEPKLMLTISKLAELSRKNREAEKLEILKTL